MLQRGNRRGAVLGVRALNRALLERQLLLRRSKMPAFDAIEHLVGLQAQVPNSPYIGLWTRLAGFALDDLTDLITKRRVVRLPLMRSTIHMVTARDCLTLRPLTQPVQNRGLEGSFGRRLKGIQIDAVAAAGRSLVEAQPRTFSELGAALRKRWPERDPTALAYAVRAVVPLVQVPPRGIWGNSAPAAHTTVDAWLHRPLAKKVSLEKLVMRYLSAFGPATVRDVQAWSGLTQLREVIDRLRRRLRVFRNEDGQELFDVPDGPRPHPDTPAPPRFLPEFDNVLLAHADRTRVIADEHRRLVFTSGGLLLGTFLIDGFVRGRWRIVREPARTRATLDLYPIERLSAGERQAATEEGDRLLAFAAADATARDVRVLTSPPSKSAEARSSGSRRR